MKTNNSSIPIYDAIGIGIGPFNLGMAALAEGTELNCLFFERKSEFHWHEGMLIEGTTLQVPFLADLVSMADPTNKFSFLSYLHQHERLYHYYFLEKFHIPRNEYNHYCQWAAGQLSSCRFGMTVEDILPLGSEDGLLYEVHVRNEIGGEIETYLAKHIVLGIGTKPQLPGFAQELIGRSVFHSADYLNVKEKCLHAPSVTVVGSGQSAAEIFLDLARERGDIGPLNWLTRSKGFFPMEYSKLGLEYFSPDYIDFFYQLPQEKKDQLLPKQDLLYKGISADTIAEIYDMLYEKTVGGKSPNFLLQSMTEVTGIQPGADSGHTLQCQNGITEDTFEVESDIIIFATGYQAAVPSFLKNLEDFIDWDEQGRYKVERDYRLKTHLLTGNEIFIQNGEMHTHGVGAPDLGLGAYRNSVILNAMAQKTIYPVSAKNVFQRFESENQWVPVTS